MGLKVYVVYSHWRDYDTCELTILKVFDKKDKIVDWLLENTELSGIKIEEHELE